MTQKVTLEKSIKVNLTSDLKDTIEKEARERGLSESAYARMILKEKVKA